MNTTLLNLNLGESEGVAILRTFSGVRKTGSEAAGVQLDLFMYWPIRTAGEARDLESMIPGAGAAYADRDSRDDDDPVLVDSNSKSKYQDDSRHLTLTIATDGQSGGGRVVLSGVPCQVIHAQFKTSKRAASFEVKARVFGLTPDHVGGLTRALQEHVGVTMAKDQQSLLGATVTEINAHRATPLPRVGQFAIGRDEARKMRVSGIVEAIESDENGRRVRLRGLGGDTVAESSTFTLGLTEIQSSINVVPNKGQTVEKMLDGYIKKAKKFDTTPSIAAVIQALGEIHVGNPTPGESWLLSSAVTNRAAKIDVVKQDREARANES